MIVKGPTVEEIDLEIEGVKTTKEVVRVDVENIREGEEPIFTIGTRDGSDIVIPPESASEILEGDVVD